MTNDEITAWVHTHMPKITIVPQVEFYSGLQVTVLLNDRTLTLSGEGQWDLMQAIGAAIQAWEKEFGKP